MGYIWFWQVQMLHQTGQKQKPNMEWREHIVSEIMWEFFCANISIFCFLWHAFYPYNERFQKYQPSLENLPSKPKLEIKVLESRSIL